MRFLLVAMLVIGALLGIVGQVFVRLRRISNQRRAIIARLESKGAFVELQPGVNRSYAEPILEVIEGSPFPDFKSVHLPKGTYEAAEIEAIARIEGLRQFSSRKAGGNDAWLAAIANAPQLTSVWIHDDQYTSEGARWLAKSNAPLQSVTLWGVPVDDEYLRLIAQQPELEQLGIQGEGVSAAGLAELLNAKKLQYLALQGGDLGGGLAQLGSHPQLNLLHLSDLEWTDADLASLQQLSGVTILSISSSKRLPKGILRAAAAMPNLRSLCLRGDFDAAEPIDSLAFPCLENFVTEGRAYHFDGLMIELAKCSKLTRIAALNSKVSERELEGMKEMYRLTNFSIGGSPSPEAIQEFRHWHPYCEYIDGELGKFPPRLDRSGGKAARAVAAGVSGS